MPSISEPCEAADWAEISCLLGKDQSISRAEIEGRLEEAGYDSELYISDIWREITWRHDITPAHHPIVTYENRLERIKTWNKVLPYTFMLLLTCQYFYRSSVIPRSQWTKIAKLFEQLTTVAMEKFTGQAINIGAPRSGTVPASFRQCLDFVCQAIGETRGHVSSYHKRAKDDGVDIVSWQPIDKRCGQIVLLVQCAAGKDWQDKTMEISIPIWRDYIEFAVDPVRAVAIPAICHSDWLYNSKKGGLLLDRLRIASLVPTKMTHSLQNDLKTWSERQYRNLPWTT